MPSTAQENASPSASSIFLPLGKRSRRDSISSPTHGLDQSALNEALNTIHTAASQSQDLTVFNEYTDPPPIVSKSDNKSIASDLQGGLTGLYNKIKSSVVTKDVVEPHEIHTSQYLVQEGPGSKPSSGRTSKVQSPKLSAFDSPISLEAPSSSLRSSSKATSVNKGSVPSTPGLKPPSGPAQSSSQIVDPALTEINIRGTNSSANHSRAGSNFDNVPTSPNDRGRQIVAGGSNLGRGLSNTRKDSSDVSRQGARMVSPAQLPDTRNLQVSHERSTSETSSVSHPSNPAIYSRPLSPKIVQDDRPAIRLANAQQGSTSGQKLAVNPLEFLGGRASQIDKPVSSATQPGSSLAARPQSPGLSLNGFHRQERPARRISQSRLPGFAISRASSTDSGLTTSLLQSNAQAQGRNMDGSNDMKGNQHLSSKPLNKLRSKLLSREFWMRDENARDCFHCGEPFTTFRRKHHCRTCGQIFDNKCTVLVNGNYFGSMGAVRVCKPCEAIITSHDEDSSDYSGDEVPLPDPASRPHTPEPSQILRSPQRFDDDNTSVISLSIEQMAKTPTMSFPVRRAFDSGSRSSEVLEFDTLDRQIPRPSSSRSLKTYHSIGHGHKRHHSRHQHIRNFKAYHEERAPFQKRSTEDSSKEMKTSAFHRDSIIDPDIAQYMSDDASSGDEQSLNMALNQEKLSRSGPDSEKTAFGGLLAAVRKGRSRIGDRSIAGFLNIGRDGDDGSVVSSRGADGLRPSRKRNLSVASSIHHRTTPRSTKERLQIVVPGQESVHSNLTDIQHAFRKSRMIRSASMHGLGAPSMELNRASIQHVHKILQQLLKDADAPKALGWEDALIPILLRATDDVDPDVQGGDDIDIRNYVKLKKIPGGKPGDTAYISGLIFTKNVALKSMPRCVMNPRILIITFALEYARYEQHFMSLDPVIRQEREYLENLVGRIAGLKPDILLAQRNISGLALDLLEKANIATIYNVKSSVLEAVSRCTQTRVAHSLDKLTSHSEQLGTCDTFEVKTFVSDGRKKTYIYLSGCAPQLGCTIALRGGDRKVLSKIKRITEFMVYVVYNLKLETCLMRDEWALIPIAPSDKNRTESRSIRNPEASDRSDNATLAQQKDVKSVEEDHPLTSPNDIHSAEAATTSVESSQQGLGVKFDDPDAHEIPDDIPVPTFYEDLVEKHETKILSASPFVKFMQPYLLMRARELERRVVFLKRLRDQDLSAEQVLEEKGKTQKFTLIQPEMLHTSLAGTSRRVREIIHAVHDAEYDKAFHNYETQKKQWEAYLSGNRNLFDPYAHQNIVVLFSQVSTTTSVPCSGPDLLAFSFYNEHEQEEEFEADCTLGQYVEDLVYRANEGCPSGSCEKKMHEHHRQYVHGEAQISVFLQPYPAKMRGLQDVILMWSQCKICGVETTITPMSASTWKYSFGKYLELSFWSADLHARAGICPHDLHRDHLRYFGYKDFALRVHYDPIELLEIIVPRMRITWKVDNDLRFRNEVYTRLEHRITRFMGSVKLRLKSINVEALLPESADECRTEIERLTRRANEEHASLIKQLQERYSNSRHWETIPLHRAIRMTQEKVAEWDTAFAEFEKNFFPSEKDIRRLATLQLKKIFLDRDVSVTSLTSNDEDSMAASTDELMEAKEMPIPDHEDGSPAKKTATLSPEKTQSVLQSVLEEHSNLSNNEKSPIIPAVSNQDEGQYHKSKQENTSNLADVQHLDLVFPLDHGRTSSVATESGNVPGQNLAFEVGEQTPGKERRKSLQVQHISKVAADENGAVAGAQDASRKTTEDMNSLNMGETPKPLRRLDADLKSSSPPLLRAHSQPAGSPLLRRETSQHNSGTLLALNAINGFGSAQPKHTSLQSIPTNDSSTNTGEKKLSDRLGFAHLKNNKFVKGHSFIPRAISSRKESRVSNLAKHFEQLSREFERERVRERKLRAARNKQSRIYPLAASKPIVEVYKDVDEAVEERNTPDDIFDLEKQSLQDVGETVKTAQESAEADHAQTDEHEYNLEDSRADLTDNEADVHDTSHAPSEAEDKSDTDDVSDEIYLPDSPEDLIRLSQEDLDMKELPKHERTSLMKLLTNFWAERSSSGWTPLEYPLGASDHIFADCDIIVREDEPSSIIAFAIDSEDYNTMLRDIQDRPAGIASVKTDSNPVSDPNDMQADVMHSLLRKTGTHLKYQFQEGPAKMLCKIFFAEQFDAVRRKCGVADRFVESMSRCLKWDSKGGKTKSLFLKTLDDRFILKSLSPIETQSFLKFAPNYFQIMSEAFFHELPSVIAKMLGFYQIIIKNPVTGVEYNWFLLVMENLFYDRVPTRIFDLKGSMRNRKINATGERNEVLLDENMVEFIYESPLFTREHSKKLLRSSVHNDTLFLARQNVMDYSLMVAIDENRKELVVGIIDCIRTYTWDKKLESWIKDRGFAGGGKNRPTVTSPREYKRRFREAMGRYVLEAPNCWHQFKPVKVEKRILKIDGDKDGDKGDNELQIMAA